MEQLKNNEGNFKKCKVVMLPTKETSSIIKWTSKNVLEYSKNPFFISKEQVPQHLYIISDDEIKEGDWYLDKTNNTIHQATKVVQNNKEQLEYPAYKIIATTDSSLTILVGYNNVETSLPQPSQSFIEKYIESYNAGKVIEDVMVEYDECQTFKDDACNVRFSCCNNPIKLKINPKDNTITIKKVKDSWNREEVIKLIQTACDDTCFNPQQIDKWIKDNL